MIFLDCCNTLWIDFLQIRAVIAKDLVLQWRKWKANLCQIVTPVILQIIVDKVIIPELKANLPFTTQKIPAIPLSLPVVQLADLIQDTFDLELPLGIELDAPSELLFHFDQNDRELADFSAIVPNFFTSSLRYVENEPTVDDILFQGLEKYADDDEEFPYIGSLKLKSKTKDEVDYIAQFQFQKQGNLFNIGGRYEGVTNLCEIMSLTMLGSCESIIGAYELDLVHSSYLFNQTNNSAFILSFVAQMPFDFDVDDQLNVDIVSLLSSFIFPLLLIVPLPSILYSLVLEKEHNIKEMMSLMGLKERNYFLPTFFLKLAQVLVTYFCMFVLGIILQFRIFVHTEFLLLCLMAILCALIVVSLAFIISSVVRNTFVATIVSYLIVVFFPIIGFFLHQFVLQEGRYEFKWLLLFSPLTVTELLAYLSSACNRLQCLGLTSVTSNPDFLVTILFTLFDFSLYMILALYLDQVMPKPWGIRKSPFFFLGCCSCMIPKKWREKVKDATSTTAASIGAKLAEKIPSPAEIWESRKKLSKMKRRKNKPERDEELEVEFDEDEDVAEMRERIVEGLLSDEEKGIVVKGLTKAFGSGFLKKKHLAVNDIYYNVGRKECFGLLGTNGAGKSTTISILSGLYSQTKGTAYINGKNISTNMSEIRRSLGLCPQFTIAWDELTPSEHLLFYTRLKGCNPLKERKEVRELLKKVELLPKKRKWRKRNPVLCCWDILKFFFTRNEKKAGELSGGMMRRLAIAMSLCGNPKLVLFDEPTTGLDPFHKRGIWNVIMKEKRDRCIILTTHSMEEAEVLSDRISIMKNGRLLCVGPALFLKDKFGSGYKITTKLGRTGGTDKVEEFKKEVIERFSSFSDVKVLSDYQGSVNRVVVFQISKKNIIQQQQQQQDIVENDDGDEEEEQKNEGSIIKVWKIFEDLERMRESEDLGLIDFEVNQASLEDVFLKVVGEELKDDGNSDTSYYDDVKNQEIFNPSPLPGNQQQQQQKQQQEEEEEEHQQQEEEEDVEIIVEDQENIVEEEEEESENNHLMIQEKNPEEKEEGTFETPIVFPLSNEEGRKEQSDEELEEGGEETTTTTTFEVINQEAEEEESNINNITTKQPSLTTSSSLKKSRGSLISTPITGSIRSIGSSTKSGSMIHIHSSDDSSEEESKEKMERDDVVQSVPFYSEEAVERLRGEISTTAINQDVMIMNNNIIPDDSSTSDSSVLYSDDSGEDTLLDDVLLKDSELTKTGIYLKTQVRCLCSVPIQIFLQILFLLEKNLLLSCKNWKSSLLQLTSPFFVVGLLFALTLLTSLIKNEEIRYQEVIPVDTSRFDKCTEWGDNKCHILAYTVNDNPIAADIMDDIILDYDLERGEDVVEFPSTQHLEDFMYQNPNVTQSAVAFFNFTSFKNLSRTVNLIMDQVRGQLNFEPFNSSVLFVRGVNLTNLEVLENITAVLYTIYYNTTNDVTNQVIPIKVILDNYIFHHVQKLKGEHVPKTTFKLSKQNFPKIENRRRVNGQAAVLSATGPLFFSLSTLTLLVVSLYRLVLEKETELRYSLEMIGMRKASYLISWFVTFVSFGVVMTLVSIVSGEIFVLDPFVNANPVFTFLIFFVFQLSLICLSFTFSSCFTKTKSALTFSFIFLSLTFILNLFVGNGAVVYLVMDLKGARALIPLAFEILYPPFNFSKLFQDIINKTVREYDVSSNQFEDNVGYTKWSDFTETNSALGIEAPPSYRSVLMLLLNCVIYLCMFLYLDQILPTPKGNAKSPIFFCFPKYWLSKLGFNIGKEKINFDLAKRNRKELGEMKKDLKVEYNRVRDKNYDAMIRIANLKKTYSSLFGRRVKALRGIDLTCARGSVLAFLGHNGAGKSTTINMIAGLMKQNSGEIFVNEYNTLNHITKVRESLGVCLQHDSLWGELTPNEHMRLFCRMKGIRWGKKLRREVKRRLEEVSLYDARKKRSSNLSGGMKRRLSVALSFVGDPRLVILDEPSTGLDPHSRRLVWKVIENAYSKNKTSIMLTTHSMEEADSLSHSISILQKGKILVVGDSLYLKGLLGGGYVLKFICKSGCEEEFEEFMKTTAFPKATKLMANSSSFIYNISKDLTEEMIAGIRVIEQNMRSAESIVKDFGISSSTLEDIYLRVTQEAEEKEKREKEERKHGKKKLEKEVFADPVSMELGMQHDDEEDMELEEVITPETLDGDGFLRKSSEEEISTLHGKNVSSILGMNNNLEEGEFGDVD